MKLQRREIRPKFEMSLEVRSIGSKHVETVNLRELHAKLGNGHKFADWIKDRIEQYDFIENKDYILISAATEIKKGGRGGDRRSVEYFVH